LIVLAAARLEARQSFEAVVDEQAVPFADRIVVEQKRLRDFLAALPRVQKHQGVGASRHATGRRTVARQRDQVGAVDGRQKPSANHAAKTKPKIEAW
jgi:hypothetical protein